MNQNTPPSLNLTGFFELGSTPIWEKGTGEFETTAIGNTIIMAGYGGDEMVTLVVSTVMVDRVHTVDVVMVRSAGGDRLQLHEIECSTLAVAEYQINEMLILWFAYREPRPDHAIEANPLKRV